MLLGPRKSEKIQCKNFDNKSNISKMKPSHYKNTIKYLRWSNSVEGKATISFAIAVCQFALPHATVCCSVDRFCDILYWNSLLHFYREYSNWVNMGEKHETCCMLFLGNSPAPEFYIPTFQNTLFYLNRQVNLPAYKNGTDKVFRNFGI